MLLRQATTGQNQFHHEPGRTEPHLSLRRRSPAGAKIKARSPSLRGTTEATGTKTDTNNEHKRNDRRRRRPVPRAQPDTEQNSACGGRGEEEGGSVYYTCFASGDGGGGEPSQRGEGGFGHGPMRRRSSLSRIDLLAVGMVGVLEGDRQWCPVRLNLFLFFPFRVACW